MLQQTRVATVIPYYERWMTRFPTVRALAAAELDEVLAAWAGLGYYSRARNLHRGAKEVVLRHRGVVPGSAAALREIPGIGRYTAGAIASIAYGHREPIVDGNVARVLARVYALEGDVKAPAALRELWQLAAELVPPDAPGDFNQGLMELGATVCTPAKPACLTCPVRQRCRARATGREHELPVMPARKRAQDLPLIDASALWIERRGRVLLARRPPAGLYGGLWELPQTADTSRLEALVPAAEVRLQSPTPVAEHNQVLSHRRLRIRVFRAHLSGRPPARCTAAEDGYDRFLWQSLAATASRGLSAATQAIIDKVQEMYR